MNLRALGVELAGVFGVRLSEHAVLDGADAVDAPLIVGDGLGELPLDGSSGREAVDEFLGERSISRQIFGGEYDDSRSKTVAECVQAGTHLALRG
ncbi:MAG: hypothetical protein M3O35_10905 [Acidobacteriota bacterium]|nr:hypothetical protein [Acidobacteriota bacterium]